LTPGWQDCPAFAQELKRGGGEAIIAQFQGYVCSKILGCCVGAAESVQLRVEETLYGDVYPHKRLPLKTCSASDNSHGDPTRVVTSGFADAAHGRSGGRRATCDACQRATRVHIVAEPSMCLPRSSSLGAPYAVQPDSIYERCTYVQDLVVSARGRLVPALQDAACACAGCCNADGDEDEEDAAGVAAAASGNSVVARSSSQQSLAAASAGRAGKRQRVCLFDADDGEEWLGSLLEESTAWLAR
jgi:hypothetical protein